MDLPPENEFCSVCHGNFHIPCQANCSHWFCGNCILQVWDHGSALQPCKCPLCRRQITLLVPSEASSRQRQSPEVSDVFTRVETYNRLFGQHSTGLLQKLQDLPFLLSGDCCERLQTLKRSLSICYPGTRISGCFFKRTVCPQPIDIIPEGFLGIIGFLDDLIIVFICFLHVAALYRSLLVFRHGSPS
nr:E3 ubiquitin-protein ligase RNF170-like [Ipomoea batatas]